jgi:hypothetical protein
MTATTVRATARSQRPAWLLISTMPLFVTFLVLATATIAEQTEASSAELTQVQLSELGAWWVALHLLWITPPLLAAMGLAMLATSWRMRGASAVRILAGITMLLALAYLVVQCLAFGFEGETWGDSRLYPLGVALSLAAGWFGALPATILVTGALARHRVAPKTAWTVAVLTTLYLALELLAYLPALAGAADLAETTGIPPFILGILWTALGVALLRSRVPTPARPPRP